MPLEIIHREHEGIEILDLNGHLTLGKRIWIFEMS
jgi:hypothetical protein